MEYLILRRMEISYVNIREKRWKTYNRRQKKIELGYELRTYGWKFKKIYKMKAKMTKNKNKFLSFYLLLIFLSKYFTSSE